MTRANGLVPPYTDYLNAMQALFIAQAYPAALAMRDDKVVDTDGAGDFFHGAYVHAFLTSPFGLWEVGLWDVGLWEVSLWEDHFRFARAACAHASQYLGPVS